MTASPDLMKSLPWKNYSIACEPLAASSNHIKSKLGKLELSIGCLGCFGGKGDEGGRGVAGVSAGDGATDASSGRKSLSDYVTEPDKE